MSEHQNQTRKDIDLLSWRDDYLLDKQEVKRRHEGYFYVTDAPKCQRALWFDFTVPIEEQTKIPVQTAGIFEAGIRFHEFVKDVLEYQLKEGTIKLLKPEKDIIVVVDPMREIYLGGRTDFVFILERNNERYCVEAKSMASIYYVKDQVEASKQFRMQLMPYMLALRCKKGYIVCGDKVSYDWKVFEVDYDTEIIKDIFVRVQSVYKSIVSGIAPQAEARLRKEMNYHCKNCQYPERCEKLDKERGVSETTKESK